MIAEIKIHIFSRLLLNSKQFIIFTFFFSVYLDIEMLAYTPTSYIFFTDQSITIQSRCGHLNFYYMILILL